MSDIVLAVAYQTFDAGFDIVAVETVLPTGLTIARYPLAMAVNLGYTTFLGPNRDALSFEYFFESGLALEADLSRKNLAITEAPYWCKGNLRGRYNGLEPDYRLPFLTVCGRPVRSC